MEISADEREDIHAQTNLCTWALCRLSSGIPVHKRAGILYIFLIVILNHIITQQSVFYAIRKDCRSARIAHTILVRTKRWSRERGWKTCRKTWKFSKSNDL